MLPGSEDADYTCEVVEGDGPFVGDEQYGTVGDRDWLCSGCGSVLFRRFAPTVEVRALTWRCGCGQVNEFP